MVNESDKIVQELFLVIQNKKAVIAKAEKPNWLTNCAFRYNKDSSASTNIQVCSDVDELVHMLGFLCEKRNGFIEAQKILGTSGVFKWFGFTFEEWASDIKTRIDKIEIKIKKNELEILESRLDKIISPELKASMELDEIKKLLGAQ
jgi:hypothetical protein